MSARTKVTVVGGGNVGATCAQVLATRDYADVVLVDIVEFCHREDIYCQGRGSAANSAVCYALGVTKADAVALGLLFERFLSPERDGPPRLYYSSGAARGLW